MEIPVILGHYLSMISLAKNENIKEKLIMQRFDFANVCKDKLSECPTLRQKLYLEAKTYLETINDDNCKNVLEIWVEYCEGLGHSANFETQTQSWH
jgi:hypothetical protein